MYTISCKSGENCQWNSIKTWEDLLEIGRRHVINQTCCSLTYETNGSVLYEPDIPQETIAHINKLGLYTHISQPGNQWISDKCPNGIISLQRAMVGGICKNYIVKHLIKLFKPYKDILIEINHSDGQSDRFVGGIKRKVHYPSDKIMSISVPPDVSNIDDWA